MSINQKLREVYDSKWQGLVSAMHPILENASEDLPASPLLLRVKDENAYQKADIKLLIFGQETNSWYESFHTNTEKILGYYDEFFNSDYYKKYGGQFWNGVTRFVSMLQDKYPNKTIYPLWNNLVKIGRDAGAGFPSSAVHRIERQEFNVIQSEIDILQPTVVLFLTGPNYDRVLQEVFQNSHLIPASKEFSVRQLAALTIPNAGQAFRTYHPGYLWRNNIDSYFRSIIDNITA